MRLNLLSRLPEDPDGGDSFIFTSIVARGHELTGVGPSFRQTSRKINQDSQLRSKVSLVQSAFCVCVCG